MFYTNPFDLSRFFTENKVKLSNDLQPHVNRHHPRPLEKQTTLERYSSHQDHNFKFENTIILDGIEKYKKTSSLRNDT